MSEREHEWRYFPTVDTNPPSEARECAICGRMEQRMGTGYANGVTIPPTRWALVRPGRAFEPS